MLGIILDNYEALKGIQNIKIMASGPITSRQIDEETVATVTDFIWGGSKILQMVTATMKLKVAYSLKEKF